MAQKDDCIFCKIANHVIESDYVYEDDLVAAFRDMNPLAPTHVLVVPKNHHETLVDGVDAETLAAMVHAVDEVAKAEGIAETGFSRGVKRGRRRWAGGAAPALSRVGRTSPGRRLCLRACAEPGACPRLFFVAPSALACGDTVGVCHL